MLFVARHQTHYRYSVPIVLAPHVLRLTPRVGEHRLQARSLVVRPEPILVREEDDAFGNRVTWVTFADRPTKELHVDSRFELHTAAPPAIPAVNLAPLPWWRPAAGDALAAYLPATAADPTVAAFARGLAAEVDHHALPFLDHLCRTIFARADRHHRQTGDAHGAAETLATWRGACRDYTVLFLTAAREIGIPGRFCSGYQAAADTPDSRRDLHAWPEVFLPGVGWRGWDPTHGVPVAEGHVALCAAPDQASTMPVAGSYSFGSSITATLDFSLDIRTM